MPEKFNEILELFNVTKPKGYSREQIEATKAATGPIPAILEQFYLEYGLTDELLHLQDNLLLPDRYRALLNDDYIIFFDENQGVCHAGIRKSEALMPDPPVYVRMDNREWKKSADRVSDFLVAMFGYQASICLEYSPEEFYFITEEEKGKIEKLFVKRKEKFENWLSDYSITLYGDNNHGRIAIMEQAGYDIQLNYAANTKEEYERMAALLGGIGEAI